MRQGRVERLASRDATMVLREQSVSEGPRQWLVTTVYGHMHVVLVELVHLRMGVDGVHSRCGRWSVDSLRMHLLMVRGGGWIDWSALVGRHLRHMVATELLVHIVVLLSLAAWDRGPDIVR